MTEEKEKVVDSGFRTWRMSTVKDSGDWAPKFDQKWIGVGVIFSCRLKKSTKLWTNWLSTTNQPRTLRILRTVIVQNLLPSLNQETNHLPAPEKFRPDYHTPKTKKDWPFLKSILKHHRTVWTSVPWPRNFLAYRVWTWKLCRTFQKSRAAPLKYSQEFRLKSVH